MTSTRIVAAERTAIESRSEIIVKAALILLVIAIHVPFLHQAFHMDDGIYLMMARNVPHINLFPQNAPILFEGLFASDAASTEHPWPVTPYLLALCSFLGGRSEGWMHAVFLAFPIMLVLSMYSIARRTTANPVMAVLTLLSMPVVYVMSHNLMTDIPLLSLWLASTAIFLDGVHSHRTSRVLIAAGVETVALLLSYAAVGLILLLILYGILRRDRIAAAIALIIPTCAFVVWMSVSSVYFHRFVPGTLIGSYIFAKGILSQGLLTQKFASIVLSLGGVAISPLVLLSIGKKRSVIGGALAAAVCTLLFGGHVSGLWQKALLFIFFWAGFSAIAEAFGTLLRALTCRRPKHPDGVVDDLFLGVWFAGSLAFCLTVYMAGAARYILPSLPPLVLIVFRRLRMEEGKKIRALFAVNIVLSGSLAICLAVSDYEFAGIYRQFASSIKGLWPVPPTKVWFAGEWGLRAYLEPMGGRELGRRDARAQPGDLLVVPSLATPYLTLYSDTLGLESIAVAAPSRMVFEIPAVRPGSTLVCTIGMPFHSQSDGMNFGIYFRSAKGDRRLLQEHITPSAGQSWRVRYIPLQEIAGQKGAIVFSSEISGNPIADWISVARARIRTESDGQESVLYDFATHFEDARMESDPGAQFDTEGNRPALRLTTFLQQEPTAVPRRRYEYGPHFPFRMLEERSHAGFWGSSWGLLPFSVTCPGSTLESITVYEITRAVDAYGESTTSWYER